MPTSGFPVPVPFRILADSGVREAIDGSGPTAEVRFSVAWGDRFEFVGATKGTATGGAGAIVRTVPAAYPPSPNLFAMTCRIEPLGKLRRDDDGWADYDRAIVTVGFSTPRWDFTPNSGNDPSGQPWTTTTFDMGGEFLTLPLSAYKFAGGKTLTAPVGRVLPQIAISYKRHWVPYLPVAEVFNLIGKLNADPVDLGNFVCPPETLLFLGAPNQRDADTAGNVVQQVDYKLMFRPISWNKFLHPDGTSGFQYLADGNGDHVYELGDFTTLP